MNDDETVRMARRPIDAVLIKGWIGQGIMDAATIIITGACVRIWVISCTRSARWCRDWSQRQWCGTSATSWRDTGNVCRQYVERGLREGRKPHGRGSLTFATIPGEQYALKRRFALLSTRPDARFRRLCAP
jgi:hypothetical protein